MTVTFHIVNLKQIYNMPRLLFTSEIEGLTLVITSVIKVQMWILSFFLQFLIFWLIWLFLFLIKKNKNKEINKMSENS